MTGATGYIGSNVVRLLAAGGWNVHVIARTDSKLTLLEKACYGVSIHRHDGSTKQLFDIIKQAAPDIVIHLAAFASVTHTPEDIVPMLQSNVVFGTQLVEAILANHVYCFINTGTFSQHCDNKDYSSSSLYDATKQAFRDILTFYTETAPLKAITLELYDNYGPGDPRSKIMNLLKRAALDGKPLAMSPGEQLVDIVYIDDVADAYVTVAERLVSVQGVKDEVYAISSGHPIRLKDLVQAFEQATGRRLQIVWGGRPYRKREIMVPWNQGAALPNWTAKVSLQEGIKRFMNLSS
ncbi:NAD-dependent epimerase/dehydratase family protein [Paenibacillus prosopidis]|uniref:NAD-dependent epimerase/dehydratase family protein n=1 Tax=Paenibacillus prosopidis TaxID=630520 RepID=UPI000DF17741